MNIFAANGEISKAMECFEQLSLLFNRDWEKRKSIKNLDRTMNMMYKQGFISVQNVEASIPEHTIMGEHECRIAFSMRALSEALEERIKRSAFSLPHTPPQTSEILMDKILNERAAVFDELVHR